MIEVAGFFVVFTFIKNINDNDKLFELFTKAGLA
jgi:hypothetical protein